MRSAWQRQSRERAERESQFLVGEADQNQGQYKKALKFNKINIEISCHLWCILCSQIGFIILQNLKQIRPKKYNKYPVLAHPAQTGTGNLSLLTL